MKEFVRFTLLFLLIAVSVNTSPGCAGTRNESVLGDIPLYPTSEVIMSRTWTELADDEPWSKVEWCYCLAADKYSMNDIKRFYADKLEAGGWSYETSYGEDQPDLILWRYADKLNMYVPGDMIFRLNSWLVYHNRDQTEWLAIWIGINKPWLEADKAGILILKAS